MSFINTWNDMADILLGPSPWETLWAMELPEELEALRGVPQPKDHHPEGCVLTHSLMALEVVCRQDYDAGIRFAVLVHDIGKGVTPAEKLPKHHGHGKAGVPLIEFE